MEILIDDGMQISVGTGIGKYTRHLYEAVHGILGDNIRLYQYEYSS